MKTLSIHETKTHMSSLLRQVERGETVVFGSRGEAQFQITKVSPKKYSRKGSFGSLKGKIKINGDIVTPDHETTEEMEKGAI